MKRIFALLLMAWPSMAGAQPRPLDLPVWRAGASRQQLPAYAGDEFSIRLRFKNSSGGAGDPWVEPPAKA